MREPNYLFSKYDWFAVQENQKKQLASEIAQMDGNRLLSTPVDDLCDYFEEKYRVNVPLLRETEITADQKETQIDVSRDRLRAIRDRTRPFYIPGTTIEITIPFDGDAEVFKIQPTSFTLSPPIADVQENRLLIKVQGTDLKADRVRSEIDKTISEIKSYLKKLKENANGLNDQLRSISNGAIQRRREKLLSDQNLVAALGFPLKERSDSPKTYVSPTVRRKVRAKLPPASTAPFTPEPTLSNDDYEHILSVIENMAQVMERSPSAFATIDEESLRSHFLVQLNGHYEGQATGETFNYEGKTDILIRVQGKNVFIAECKYWGGPKKLTETIDQLLGYSSWRDMKVAVIIFSRNRNLSKVLDSIPQTVEVHRCYKRFLGKMSETNFRYVFSNRDDPNREMILSVLVFDVPDMK
ncbi:conserved hypothetical protein [Desulfatibacillum aliphaticivorans]|uniref:Uncharacterized protein n=1 Tax=Desulfatibacillum aliphaticivorans TaxID=218208 RepID=B8F9P6_DESAL|nr:hypothetical protein [Desulfatibacillum aliphaticivorans]ACL02992.1 conserved hypothetical protein [Desulfatibacillum aliphaticivorans]